MDHAVSKPRAALPRVALLALAGCAFGGAWALGPKAPFAPPAASEVAAQGAAGVAGTAGAAIAPSAAAAAQSGIAGVRLGSRAMALIDGEWWPLGGRPRGAELSAIDRRGAWLRYADGRSEFLALVPAPATPMPGTESTPRAAAAAAAPLARPSERTASPTAKPAAHTVP